eukprot:gene3101-2274_t
MKELQTGDQILISPGSYSGINNTGFNPLRFGLSGSYSFHRASIVGNGDPTSVMIIGGLFNTRFMDLYDDGFVLISNVTFKDFALPKVTSYLSNELEVLGVNVVGGTFSVTNASIEFKNLNFYNNTALFGAAISAVKSDISVANCEFAYNVAGYHGGAISVGQSSITVTGSRFYNNSASSVRQQLAASGGAIFSVGVTTNHTTIIDSIFVNNTADHNGGAVSLEPGTTLPQLSSGSVLFKHCKFYKNEATGVGSCLSTTSCIPAGGAIYVTSANVSVAGCHFEENRAHTVSTIDLAEGGAIFSTNLLGSKGTSRSMTRITHSTFVKNSAWGYGGAIYFDKQRFQIFRSSFDANKVLTSDPLFCDTPAAGGAIYVSYSNSHLNSMKDTNFSSNIAVTGWGGAVYATETSALSMYGVIFSNNFAVSSYTNAALGGAVMVTGQCALTIDDCEFSSNAAVPLINKSPMTYSGGGGGLFAQSSSVSIQRSTFTRNYAFTGQFDGGSTGGAIVLEDCYPANIDQSTFEQNGAIGFLGKSSYASCGTGGAVYAKFSALGSPTSKGVSGLTADGGAVSASLNSNVTVLRSTFFHNAALYGTGDDFASIAVEENEENFLNFRDVVFNTADPTAVIAMENKISYLGSSLCKAIETYVADLRFTFASVASATAKKYIPTHQHRALADEYTLVEDYGIHVSVPKDATSISAKKAFVHVFDVTFEVDADDILVFDDELGHHTIDEDHLVEALHQHGQSTLAMSTKGENKNREVEEMMPSAGVSTPLAILEKSLSFLKTKRGEFAKKAAKEKALLADRLSRATKRKSVTDKQETVDADSEDRHRRLTSIAATGQEIAAKFINALPDVITTRGKTTFVNPTFIGEYHVFVGDYTSYLLAREGIVESASDDYYRSYMQFLGSIFVDNLTLTTINADVYSDVMDSRDHENLRLSRMNVFNSSILFTSNIVVEDQSVLLDSSFVGQPGKFAPVLTALNKPNITFQSDVVTGYSLPEIFGYERSLRPALHDYTDRRRNATNSSLSSTQLYRGCDVFIEGRMVVDSPFHAIDVYLGTVKFVDRYFDFFSDSQIILEKNATMTVRNSGSLNLLTNTLIQSDDETSTALINYGDVALLGTTISLVYQTDSNPDRLQEIAHSGSLGSKLTVLGNYVQLPSGTISVYLNYTYQVQPVVYLANNRTFSGSIFVDFYGVNPYQPDSNFCPGLQLGSDPSIFTVLSFLYSGREGLDHVGDRYLAEQPAKVSSVQGITFDMSIQDVYIDVLDATVHNQVLEVESISCENVFSYYAGVAAAAKTDSQYPCYVCLQNSSCSLCQSPSGTRTCAETNFCPSTFVEVYTGDCCGGCGKDGTCHANNADFSSFSCKYDCSWFYSESSECQAFSTQGLVVIFVGCALFLGVLGVYYMFRRTAQQKEQVLEELREGILRHTLTANNEYIQDMQQALILNDVFVKYDELKIESKVGEGSFGVVHKATFRGAQVAVKQMRSMFLEITDKEIEEFRKEAYMMSRLRHPNIVLVMGITLVDMEPVQPKSRTLNSVMDSDMPGNSDKDKDKKKPPKPQKTVCIITEFLEQGSLADILYGPTRLPPEIFTYELILTIALQAARGMLYLHSHQPPICHRDLKSSNLVVDDHWVVKVTDFGMSRIVPERVQDEDKGVGEDDRESLGGGSIAEISDLNAGSIMVTSSSVHSRTSGTTNGGQTQQTGGTAATAMTAALNLEMTSNLGTTAWCAPEVLTSSSRTRYSIKVDVYSYGMVLWELYEKKRPFEEYSSRFDIMDAVKAGKRPAISEHCPPTYKALIKRCWQTEPSRRPTFNYIVRYLKDELARVKRSKAVVQSQSTGFSQFSNFPRPGSMSAYIRQSFSTGQGPDGQGPIPDQNGRPSISILSRFSMSANQNRDSVSHHSTAAVASAINNPLQSVVHGGNDLESGDLKAEDVGLSPVASMNNNPMSYLEERRQAEMAAERATVVRDAHHTGLGGSGNPAPPSTQQRRESFKNLPENRTPLVAAVDRSLSYLTESPAMSQPFRPYQKYGAPQHNTWRDKYVMQFSGWNSANPDAGLPPQSRPVAGASPSMSFSPATGPDMARHTRGAPGGSPSRQMPPPNNYPRGFIPSAGPGSMPSSQAQSPSTASPIALSTSQNDTSHDDNALFTMDDEHSQSSGK